MNRHNIGHPISTDNNLSTYTHLHTNICQLSNPCLTSNNFNLNMTQLFEFIKSRRVKNCRLQQIFASRSHTWNEI